VNASRHFSKRQPPSVNPNGIPSISPALRRRSYAGELARRVINPERVASVPRQPHRARVIQLFQGCAGFGCMAQGGSVRAGLANLATRGLSDAIPLGLRNRRGLAGNAQGVLYGFFHPPKIIQNSWRDWAAENALNR